MRESKKDKMLQWGFVIFIIAAVLFIIFFDKIIK